MEKTGLRQMMDMYMSMVYRNAFRILCDRRDAETVARQVFVSLWKKSGAVQGSIEDWLLLRTCMYCRLRIMRWRLLWIFNVRRDVFVVTSRIMDEDNDYEAKQAWQLFCRASFRMTPLQRMSYALCVLEGLEKARTASILRISRTRLSLALERAAKSIRSELSMYGKSNLYMPYVAFVRRVADDGRDVPELEDAVFATICSDSAP